MATLKHVIVDKLTKQECWWARTWRPMAFWVYAAICIFDFILMPVWFQINYYDVTRKQAIESSLKYDQKQLEALTVLINRQPWEPITLQGGGLLHLSFGAILTGTAITRGREKEQQAKQLGEALKSKIDNPDEK